MSWHSQSINVFFPVTMMQRPMVSIVIETFHILASPSQSSLEYEMNLIEVETCGRESVKSFGRWYVMLYRIIRSYDRESLLL